MGALERHGTATSTNWSGYAVTGANGAYTDVKGSWVEPSVLERVSQPVYPCLGASTMLISWETMSGFVCQRLA